MSTTQVFGVTLINPSDTSSTHFLDCTSHSTPPGQLRWEREEGTHRFDTYASPDLTSLRLDLAPKSGPFTSADLGVYICVDMVTGERQSVTIADGMYVTYNYRAVFEAASRTCKNEGFFIKRSKVRKVKVNRTFLLEGIQIEDLLPCLVSQLAPLAELYYVVALVQRGHYEVASLSMLVVV